MRVGQQNILDHILVASPIPAFYPPSRLTLWKIYYFPSHQVNLHATPSTGNISSNIQVRDEKNRPSARTTSSPPRSAAAFSCRPPRSSATRGGAAVGGRRRLMPRPSPSRVFSPPSRRLFPSSRLLDRRRGCRTASCRCAGGWEEALQEPLIRGGASCSRCGASMAAGSTGELHGQGLVDRGVRRRAPAAVIFLGGRCLCCMGPGRTRCTRGNSTLLLFYADSSWSCSSSMTCLIIWFGEVASIVVGWEQEPPVIGS